MCQRQYSNCKYLESSSPFIFVSVINLQNSTHLSPTHPGFTDAICLCLSTEVPKPLLTLIFDVCCHPTYFQCTPCQRPLSRHWGTAVTVGHCGAYTGVNSQWPSSGQLAREVPMSKWGREEWWAESFPVPWNPPSTQLFVWVPRGHPSLGLWEESVIVLERLQETRWGGQGLVQRKAGRGSANNSILSFLVSVRTGALTAMHQPMDS